MVSQGTSWWSLPMNDFDTETPIHKCETGTSACYAEKPVA